MEYRLRLRGFQKHVVEDIVRHSSERYMDTETGRWIAVGVSDNDLVMVPYEETDGKITPVTIHVTNRQQLNARIKSERLKP